VAGAAPTAPTKTAGRVAVGGAVAGSPTIGPDGTIYVASHDGAALRGRARRARPPGASRLGDRSWSTPAVAEDGTIYVGSDDDHLYAVIAPTARSSGSCASAHASRAASVPSRRGATSTGGR
jgi:outer membrane protein assembly factor BamB